jgi:hypothetical protein
MERLLAGRYRLGGDLGAGGTARVVRATDERLGREVAVKLLDSRIAASADPSGRDRFLQECRTLAGFSHPGAVLVFDAGEDDGDLFLVMELVEGTTLAHRLAHAGPMSIAESVRVSSEILSVLAAAHSAGIVHRDVKPANVLLGDGGVVKLADFGIAKRFDDVEESVTATGFVIGTPRYLAPEQAMGETITPATDVYAVGVLLYEMLAGHPPFAGDSAVAIAVAQQASTAPDIRDVRPEVPQAVAAAIAAALARDPAQRPATAAELESALHAAASAADAGRVPTMLMPGGVAVGGADIATRVVPVAGMPQADPTARNGSNPGVPTWALVVVALVVVTLIAAFALGSPSDEQLGSSGSELDALAAAAAAASASVATTVSPTALTTVPPTVPPTEPAVPTEPPAPTQPAVAEVVPGFPVTEDLTTFLEQMERNPALVGASGEELSDMLEAALAERGRKQTELVDVLRFELRNFVEQGEVDPSIAAELDRLLIPLAGRGSDDDDDD